MTQRKAKKHSHYVGATINHNPVSGTAKETLNNYR